jgi:hypothetical protein
MPTSSATGCSSLVKYHLTRSAPWPAFTLVEAHGFGREDIHQLTIYVVGSHQNLLDAWAAIVRGFDLDVPPATLLGVQCLGYEQQLVELDARVERLG